MVFNFQSSSCSRVFDSVGVPPSRKPAVPATMTTFPRCHGICSLDTGVVATVLLTENAHMPPSTHTPPPHTSFPMSAHLLRLRPFQRHLRSFFWVWVWGRSGFGIGFTLHLTRSFTRSSPSRHPPFTHDPFPSRSLVRDGHTSYTCLGSSYLTAHVLECPPPRTQIYHRSCSNKHTLLDLLDFGERERERALLGTIHNGGSRARA